MFKRGKILTSKNLHTKGTTHPAKDKIKFNLVGNVNDYSFTIQPITAGKSADRVRVQRQKIGNQFVQNASISVARAGNSIKGRFTNIRDDFPLVIRLR